MAKETVEFTIGGEKIAVPVMTFWDLEQCQAEIELLGPDLTNISYSLIVFNIVGHLLEPDDETAKAARILALKKSCSISEMLAFGPAMSELFRVSGFVPLGEAQAAQNGNGTGTSTDASPSLPLEEFAEGTPTASSVN